MRSRLPFVALCGFLLFAIALSLPWDVFQRIPFWGITITKCAGGLLILLAVVSWFGAPERRFPRTGLEYPILLFAVTCLVSVLHSIDRSSSLDLLRTYATYLLLFYAVVVLVSSLDLSASFSKAFVFSSAGLAVLSLVCGARLLLPAKLAKAGWVHMRVISEMRAGSMMRLAAASEDLNQGALPLLLAFSISIFLFDYRAMRRTVRWPLYVMNAALAGAVVLTLSRSSILAVAALCAVAMWVIGRRRGKGWQSVILIIVLFVVVGFLNYSYSKALIERLMSGYKVRDPSYIVRLAGLKAAFEILPQYWLFGTGLGASDAALKASQYSAAMHGTTLHSVPLKILIETGIVGLFAYLWLWASVFKQVWLHLARAKTENLRRLGKCFLALAFSCFLVMALQPFAALSIFPFLLGLAFGPISKIRGGASSKKEEASCAKPPCRAAVVALCFVGLIVAFNVTGYQLGARRLFRFADALEHGLAAERVGDWEQTELAYQSALSIARRNKEGEISLIPWERSLANVPYSAMAVRVIDIAFVYKEMEVGNDSPDPQAVAEYGLGRVAFARGQFGLAAEHFTQAAKLVPAFSEAWRVLGECLWEDGRYADALKAYASAAENEALPENQIYLSKMAHVDSRIEILVDAQPPSSLARIEAAMLLRKRGRWDEAVAIYEKLVDDNAVAGDAWFNLGVAADAQGNQAYAAGLYAKALNRSPKHYAALHRLLAFSD